MSLHHAAAHARNDRDWTGEDLVIRLCVCWQGRTCGAMPSSCGSRLRLRSPGFRAADEGGRGHGGKRCGCPALSRTVDCEGCFCSFLMELADMHGQIAPQDGLIINWPLD